MRISNLTDFTLEIAVSTPVGVRDLFVTATIKNSAQAMQSYFDIANATLQAGLKSVPSLIDLAISFQPLPQTIISKASSTGGNSLGLDASSGDLVNILLSLQWTNASDDAQITAGAKSLISTAEAASKALGAYDPYLYLNYAAQWQKPIHGYGAQSVAFLKSVSAKYDPEKVFQRLVPGGFKLND